MESMDLIANTQILGVRESLVRLLALRTFGKVAPDPNKWLDFYRSYKRESDAMILQESTSLAFLTGLPNSVDFLIEVRERSDPPISPDYSDHLDNSIDFLRKRAATEK